MSKLLLIAVGGALGSLARYGIQGLIHRTTGWVFPVGTLVVNVVGCLLIGILAAALLGPSPIHLRAEYRVGLMVGVLGGFTTFSAFGLETFALVNNGQWGLAGLNVVGSCTLGLAAVWLGYRMAETWLGVS